ncbi:MAG: hypothetical protein WCJ30_08580 [Deltaproteobacteria bacterium]
MSNRGARWVAISLAGLTACGGPEAGPDASSSDASVDITASDATDAPRTDGADALAPTDGPTPDSGADAAACAVSDAGALQTNYYCDLAIIHVLEHTGGPARVVVQARVGTGSDTCGAIDGVDILRGSTLLAQLGPTAQASLGNEHADIASGDAPALLVGECSNETTRLSAYGLVVRGRDSHGPFEARCGTAESGSRWPPGTSLACHRNIDRPPFGPASIQVTTMSFGSSASMPVMLPHAAGQPAATAVDGTVRVVSPQYASFGPGAPLTSHDTAGWMGNVSEGITGLGATTQISLNQFGTTAVFDTALCPPPTMPGPGMPPPPPWFVARVTGQGPAGPVQIEVLTSCVTQML